MVSVVAMATQSTHHGKLRKFNHHKNPLKATLIHKADAEVNCRGVRGVRLSLQQDHTADQYELQRRWLAALWLGIHRPTLLSSFVLVFESITQSV